MSQSFGDYFGLISVKCGNSQTVISNLLYLLGVGKGDRVAIYMPLTIDITVALLSCARIGAIHSVVVCQVLQVHVHEFTYNRIAL